MFDGAVAFIAERAPAAICVPALGRYG